MSDELSKGWATARISELCDVPKEKGREGVVPYLEIGNVNIGSKNYTFTEKPSVKGCRVAKKNDVLVSKVRPTRGAIIYVREDELQVSSAFTVLRNRGALAENCLWQFLAWNRGYLNHLGENCTGTMYPTTSDEAITDFEMPLPPLAEQRRIVVKLEKLLGQVDACQQRLAKMPALLKRFRQSVLAAACSGRLTADWREDAAPQDLIPPEPANPDEISEVEETVEAPEAWRWLPLQVLCDPDRSICYGVIKLGVEVPEGIPCLRTSDVKPLLIDTTGVKRISPVISGEYQRTLLRGGEVLVNVRGTLGGVAVVPDSLRGWNISREVAIVPTKGVVAQFIAFWIASLRCQNWLSGVAKGVAYTGINIADLKLLPVALPSLPEQKEIVRRVEGLFALADQLELRLKMAVSRVCGITPSLLARAFAGKLVPQDPQR